MNGYDILKKLSLEASQETSMMKKFSEEVIERLKDIDLITEKYEDCLLIGVTASEMAAWTLKFGKKPIGISLDSYTDEYKDYILKQDMHDLDFPDDSFDFVYASQVLEHSPAPIIVLIQIYRVLRKGGKGFFWMPSDPDNQKQKYHYSCFPRDIWKDLITKAGFEVNMMVRRLNSWGYDVSKIKYPEPIPEPIPEPTNELVELKVEPEIESVVESVVEDEVQKND